MIFHKMSRDFEIPKGTDYVFDKMDDFEKILPYLYTKIQGTWRVLLVDMRIQDCRTVIEELSIPEHLTLDIYLKADVLATLWAEYPKFRTEQKSKWDQYLEIVANFPRLIEKRASSEIFKRCHGNAEDIRNALATLLTMSEENETITIKHVNAVLLASDTVYARDVILTLLLKPNTLVPLRGHTLSRYKYNNAFELYDKLEHAIGKQAAFYSMRKFLRKLYEAKLDYLKNKEVKEAAIMQVLDVYEILHAYLCFSFSSPLQVMTCLFLIEERTKHASSFERTILAHYNQHLGPF